MGLHPAVSKSLEKCEKIHESPWKNVIIGLTGDLANLIMEEV